MILLIIPHLYTGVHWKSTPGSVQSIKVGNDRYSHDAYLAGHQQRISVNETERAAVYHICTNFSYGRQETSTRSSEVLTPSDQ